MRGGSPAVMVHTIFADLPPFSPCWSNENGWMTGNSIITVEIGWAEYGHLKIEEGRGGGTYRVS